MRYLFFVLLCLGFASQTSHATKVSHYKAQKPATLVAAEKQLREGLALLQEKMQLPEAELKGQNLETVHEITYSVENAVKKIRTRKEFRKNWKTFADELENLHLASERQEVEKAKLAFAKMGAEIDKLGPALATEAQRQ